MEHVEDARRRSWGEQSARNKESAERGTPETTERSADTNTIAGSGERATTVANTDSNREKRNQSQDGQGSGSEQDSSDVANTESIGSYGGENKNNQRPTGNKKIEGKAGRVSGDVAHNNQQNVQASPTAGNDEKNEKKSPHEHDRGRSSAPGGKIMEGNWIVEPDVVRVAHGVPDRTHRHKALGNSVVPQIPYYLAKAILEVTDA
jgi:site-specific DNA-cytosine methylase